MALPTASDNAFPSLLITEGTEPAAPAAGKQRLYIDSTSHHLKRTDSSGVDVDMETSSGAVATDAIWDAAGDLAVGTGADTAARVAKGAAGTVPTYGASTIAPAFPPGYEFDYVEFTAPVSITATTEATANTVVTGSAVAYNGSTVVRIEFFCPYGLTPVNAGGSQLNTYLYDGASSIGRLEYRQTGPSSIATAVDTVYRLTPSNATHTYSIRSAVNVGTGSMGAGAGGNGNIMPGYIRITQA